VKDIERLAQLVEFTHKDFVASLPTQITQWLIFRECLDDSAEGLKIADQVSGILEGIRSVHDSWRKPSDGSELVEPGL